ncbi:MAG TPA: hypothetical protein DCS20_03210 [Candidatus Yonathbacteria bacterium]|nr:hypothetical protein [Candidatus Yonathbacteria bacterium]
MNYKKIFAMILCVLPFAASAANPSVQYFTVNNSSSASINSGQVASFSWRTADSGGYSFVIPCTQGIKFKKADGSAFVCDTPVTSTATATDYIEISAWNLSGATKSFTARITPKDASGADISGARQDVSISITALTEPIESMTGTTTIASAAPYTLSWSSSFLDGVNLSISCSSTIRTTSPSYTNGFLPCNTPIFVSDLAGSGSLNLVFDNSAPTTNDIVLTLLPAMAPNTYNGAQAKTLTVSVETNVVPDPITTSFTSSETLGRVMSGAPITLSWLTERSSGANLRISCNDNITTTITIDSASSTPKCNTIALDTTLPVSGSATISFANKNYTTEPITIILTPGRKTGGFDATRGKELSFSVLPKGAVLTPSSTTPAIAPIVPTTPNSTTPSLSKILFTRYLVRGSSNSEVRALQEFLAKDKVIYPEAVISGYFGPATERAIKRLQVKYSVASIGVAGYGTVGPKTRALLNSLNK